MVKEQKKKHQESVTDSAEKESAEVEPTAAAIEGEESDLETLQAEWANEKAELEDKLLRRQADLENLRRISKQEQSEAREYALHDFLSRLLPVLDNIERALAAAETEKTLPSAYLDGLEMIRKQLVQILEQEGVIRIDAVDCQFDPNCHHAVMQEDSEDHEPGTVLEELQKGYYHRKRVLRPAMVKVCRD